ncbi:unnamed protein product [Zymoseptoria tritici ST99CH_3D1]|nr:unnamed protein product [Zymoseptoria tritici ST99CH_3D1]
MASPSGDDPHASTTISSPMAPDLNQVGATTSPPPTMKDQQYQTEDSSPTVITNDLPCPLLELSAELRNAVWTLAFADVDTNRIIDIFTATGPSSALLRTCRQINSEAGGIFDTSQRSYWKENKFTIEGEYEHFEYEHDGSNQVPHIRALRGKGVQLIENISFHLKDHNFDVTSEPVPGTDNLAWTMMLAGEEVRIRGVCFIDRYRAFMEWKEEGEPPPTIAEIHTMWPDLPVRPKLQGLKFAQVWREMIHELWITNTE